LAHDIQTIYLDRNGLHILSAQIRYPFIEEII